MKKLLLTILGLLAGGMVYAQFPSPEVVVNSTLSKVDDTTISITDTRMRKITVKLLLSQRDSYTKQMATLQSRIDAIDEQLAQASALGVASATTAISAQPIKVK